jgi:hypothetical protein
MIGLDATMGNGVHVPVGVRLAMATCLQLLGMVMGIRTLRPMVYGTRHVPIRDAVLGMIGVDAEMGNGAHVPVGVRLAMATCLQLLGMAI